MRKYLHFAFIVIFCHTASAQQSALVVKKNQKTIQKYWLHSFFAFQTHNNIWRRGELMILKKDSFYIRPRVVTIGMFVNDTAYFPLEGYAMSDVLHLPIKGLLIDYKDGKFQVIRNAGNMNLYWLKSGFIFRAGALGYTALTVINGLLVGSLSLGGAWLPVAAGVYLGGYALKRIYKPIIPVGKQYKLSVLTF
jgi:hypothetical protein